MLNFTNQNALGFYAISTIFFKLSTHFEINCFIFIFFLTQFISLS
jgi:hypothetical protein